MERRVMSIVAILVAIYAGFAGWKSDADKVQHSCTRIGTVFANACTDTCKGKEGGCGVTPDVEVAKVVPPRSR